MFNFPAGLSDPLDEIFDIQRSLRIRSSAYLSRTPSVGGNRTTWTWSGWVKRGALSNQSCLFGTNTTNAGTTLMFGFGLWDNTDRFCYYINGQSQAYSNAVFRDASSFYHIVVALDSTNAVASERLRLFVNGVRCYFGTDIIVQNTQYDINRTSQHLIGLGLTSSQFPFDGVISNVDFIDGQSLAPTSFGKFHPKTGQWRPIRYSGSYGTNGFYLPFSDSSAVAALGYDKSGNGNNWTPTNISLTAGITYDSMLDTPTNNFATLNPLLQSSTLSNANLVATVGATYKVVPGSMAIDAQNADGVYWESVCTAGTARQAGIVKATQLVNPASNVNQTTAGWVMWRRDGSVYNEGSVVALGVAWAVGDVLGWGLKGGGLYLFKNGVALNGGNPVVTGKTGDWYPFWGNANSTGTDTHSVNFGQFPFLSGASYYPAALGYFMYAPPAGFKSLCTKNMPVFPSTGMLLPSKHFDVVLDTGANIKATAEAKYPNFLEWIKDRANANNHQLIDSVRGSAAVMQSNTVSNETTYATPAGSSVGWVWNAGVAPVTNNAGSIASQVSANKGAGISVLTYTGTGIAGTVGHGLNAAPDLMIFKPRNGNGTTSGVVWHSAFGAASNSDYLYLDSTIAKGGSGATALFNNTMPESSVFSVAASSLWTNYNTWNYVAYCFTSIPGFSKFGKYTGNSSADGPYVHCGFRPAFVMVKAIDSAGWPWRIFDNDRSPYNQAINMLNANDNGAEQTTLGAMDMLSNGFKPRSTDGRVNGGATYIFAAFAEFPFRYANAR